MSEKAHNDGVDTKHPAKIKTVSLIIPTEQQSQQSLNSPTAPGSASALGSHYRRVSSFNSPNSKLKELLAIPLTPFTPAAGSYRCSICWETASERSDFILPCRCRSESLRYVSFSPETFSNQVGPSTMYRQLGQC
jgi:hypothetical protein